jgi:hypothetical protein
MTRDSTRGLIAREAGVARSIGVLVPAAELPPLDRDESAPRGRGAASSADDPLERATAAVREPVRCGARSGEHSAKTTGRIERLRSASSSRRGRSFVVTIGDATAVAGRREVTAKIVEADAPPDQADRLGLRLAHGVVDLVAELLVEIVREDEGRDGAAAIVDHGGADP